MHDSHGRPEACRVCSVTVSPMWVPGRSRPPDTSEPGTSAMRCVISLATVGHPYVQGLRRLEHSLSVTHFSGELVCWRPGEFPSGAPAHRQVPFAFKPYCFAEARRQGFDSVLWLDSSCVALRSLDPVFRQIEREGHVIFRNGSHSVGAWSSDRALDELELSRAQAMKIPEVNAAAIGLGLRHAAALEFLDRWIDAAQGEVAFRGVDEELLTRADYSAVKWNRDGRVSGRSTGQRASTRPDSCRCSRLSPWPTTHSGWALDRASQLPHDSSQDSDPRRQTTIRAGVASPASVGLAAPISAATLSPVELSPDL